MANIDTQSSILVFSEEPFGSTGDGSPCGAPSTTDYWRARERAERAAAKAATSTAARHLHQELAQIYARLLQEAYAE
jgi:hypothetical protein